MECMYEVIENFPCRENQKRKVLKTGTKSECEEYINSRAKWEIPYLILNKRC